MNAKLWIKCPQCGPRGLSSSVLQDYICLNVKYSTEYCVLRMTFTVKHLYVKIYFEISKLV